MSSSPFFVLIFYESPTFPKIAFYAFFLFFGQTFFSVSIFLKPSILLSIFFQGYSFQKGDNIAPLFSFTRGKKMKTL